MNGWHVSVYRLAEPAPLIGIRDVSALLARFSVETEREELRKALVKGERLAVWQAHLGGLGWIDELVEARRTLEFSNNGYPNTYVALARDLTPQILNGPALARSVWIAGSEDIILPGWEGETVVDTAGIAECSSNEWLIVEAWDES